MKIKTAVARCIKGLTAALLLATVLWTSTALASARVTITVKNPDPYLGNHSWFVYENAANDVIEDVATLKNFSNEPATVEVYAVDATSSEGGSFILTFKNEEQKGIGVWTEFDQNEYVIGPRETIDIPFRIKIPSGILPGQHLGGIVVENKGTGNGKLKEYEEFCEKEGLCGTGVSVTTRIGARVYLNVPGEIKEDVELVNMSAGKDLLGFTTFNFTIANNGTIAYEPKAEIKIYDAMGQLHEVVTGNLGSSLPDTTIRPVLKMKKRPFIGSFTAEADVTFNPQYQNEDYRGAALTESRNVSFIAVPWELIIPLAILIAIVIIFFQQRKLALRNFLAQSEEYIVREGDNIVLIAQKKNYPWKKLAKFNGIKPPYILKKGQKLNVPKTKN